MAAERFFRLSKVGRLHTHIYQSCVVYRPNTTNGAIFHLSIVITLIHVMYLFEFFFFVLPLWEWIIWTMFLARNIQKKVSVVCNCIF